MKTISLNNFSNGIHEPRTRVTGGCISSRHFILGTTKLTPYRDTVTESLDTGVLTDQKLTSVVRVNYNPTSYDNSTTHILALGQAGASDTNPKFYQKSTINSVTASFQAAITGEDTTGVVIQGSLIAYKSKIYCLKTLSNQTRLVEFNRLTTTLTDLGDIGPSPTTQDSVSIVPKMIVHPKDNKLYIATGSTVKSFDGTTLSAAVTFSTEHNITSMTHLGSNIVLGMVSKGGSGSVLGLWSGDTTSAVLIDVINFGSDTLILLANLNDTVIGVSALSIGGSSDVGTQNNVTIRGYAGGTAVILKRIESVGLGGSRVYPFPVVNDNKLYFPMSAWLNGQKIHQVWAVYQNGNGWVVTPDRKVSNDTELDALSVTGLSMIGDYMWVAFSDGQFRRTNDQESYLATSSYTTLVNPGMPLEDCSKEKVLRQVTVRYGSPTGASMSFNVDYSVDGGTVYQTATAVVGSTDKIGVVEATAQTDNSPYLSGREFIFNLELTGYGEIYEIIYKYDLINTTL